jgi:hypothetical protein
MKFAKMFSLLLLTLAGAALAQEATESEMNRLEDLRYESMKNADEAAMKQIFADDFVYQTLQGRTFNKESYMALFKSGDVKIHSFKRDNTRVKFYNDTATVMANTNIDVEFSGKRQQVSLFYLNVWAKRDGRWQLVARQSTALPKAQ